MGLPFGSCKSSYAHPVRTSPYHRTKLQTNNIVPEPTLSVKVSNTESSSPPPPPSHNKSCY
ncbi:hypothetical protein LIA77_05725 [Sarocladium implicatum]|nr:hypothetical protein LIA77_05725 [Sarocladium implicatum]